MDSSKPLADIRVPMSSFQTIHTTFGKVVKWGLCRALLSGLRVSRYCSRIQHKSPWLHFCTCVEDSAWWSLNGARKSRIAILKRPDSCLLPSLLLLWHLQHLWQMMLWILQSEYWKACQPTYLSFACLNAWASVRACSFPPVVFLFQLL